MDKSYKERDITVINEPMTTIMIAYTEWLLTRNLMICEGTDGYHFRDSMIGGKKYTPGQLYSEFMHYWIEKCKIDYYVTPEYKEQNDKIDEKRECDPSK